MQPRVLRLLLFIILGSVFRSLSPLISLIKPDHPHFNKLIATYKSKYAFFVNDIDEEVYVSIMYIYKNEDTSWYTVFELLDLLSRGLVKSHHEGHEEHRYFYDERTNAIFKKLMSNATANRKNQILTIIALIQEDLEREGRRYEPEVLLGKYTQLIKSNRIPAEKASIARNSIRALIEQLGNDNPLVQQTLQNQNVALFLEQNFEELNLI